MSEPRPKCLVVLTALRFSPDYGTAALRSAVERGEDVLLCVVLDPELPDTVCAQLADVGFLGERLTHDLQDTMAAEYRNRGLEHLHELTEEARALGLQAESIIREGPFLETVVAVARERGVQRVVVSRLDRPHVSRVFFGSDIDRLVRRAPCPVEVFDWSGAPVLAARR
jgi:nucleotide-binding universal stress UspA family protein